MQTTGGQRVCSPLPTVWGGDWGTSDTAVARWPRWVLEQERVYRSEAGVRISGPGLVRSGALLHTCGDWSFVGSG